MRKSGMKTSKRRDCRRSYSQTSMAMLMRAVSPQGHQRCVTYLEASQTGFPSRFPRTRSEQPDACPVSLAALAHMRPGCRNVHPWYETRSTPHVGGLCAAIVAWRYRPRSRSATVGNHIQRDTEPRLTSVHEREDAFYPGKRRAIRGPCVDQDRCQGQGRI
jgi:hypothetical protein